MKFNSEKQWRPLRQLQVLQEVAVTNVRFYDAQAYAAYVGKKLPTEPEWVKAALGFSGTKYPWGDDWRADACNASGAISAPGKFELDKSAVGCNDMAGNVSEWTRSIFMPLPYDRNDGREDQTDITFDKPLVIKGGNYRTIEMTIAARKQARYQEANETLGFRCVIEFPKELADIDKLITPIMQ